MQLMRPVWKQFTDLTEVFRTLESSGDQFNSRHTGEDFIRYFL